MYNNFSRLQSLLCQTILMSLQRCQAQYTHYGYQASNYINQIQNAAPLHYQNNIGIYNPPVNLRRSAARSYSSSDSESTEECECSCNECYNPIDCCIQTCDECLTAGGYTRSHIYQGPYYTLPQSNIMMVQYVIFTLQPPHKTPISTNKPIGTSKAITKTNTPYTTIKTKASSSIRTTRKFSTTRDFDRQGLKKNMTLPKRTRRTTKKITNISPPIDYESDSKPKNNNTKCKVAANYSRCYSRNLNKKGEPIKLYIETKYGLMPLVRLWSALKKPITPLTTAQTLKYEINPKSTTPMPKHDINPKSTTRTLKYKLKALSNKFAKKLIHELKNNNVLMLQNNIV